MSGEIEKHARSLHPDCRNAIMRLSAQWTGHRISTGWARAGIERYIEVDHKTFYRRLTPLGQQVRQFLDGLVLESRP